MREAQPAKAVPPGRTVMRLAAPEAAVPSAETAAAPASAAQACACGGGCPRCRGGSPLAAALRADLEPRYGHDFSAVRVHDDGAADRDAQALRARAYTSGSDIVFAAGAHAPDSSAGRRLLAHELAHVVQQARGAAPPGLSQPGDAMERSADAVADRVMAGRDASHLLPPAASHRQSTLPAVQRQYPGSSAGTVSNPNALIPVADFIRYVESVEAGYPSDTPQQVLTRIRQLYYSGYAFDQLIVDAPTTELVETFVPMRDRDVRRRVSIPRTVGPGHVSSDAWSHLTARADENAIGDNPSPYIVLGDGSRVDAGHLLLGLDSLLNPRVGAPYSSYGIPGIDPAGFAADLALASYWTTYHLRTGAPASDAAVKPATADFDTYYRASAPNEDLLGDADAFGLQQQWNSAPGQTLSQVLRAYYLGSTSTPAGVNRRWRGFCASNGLSYTLAGGTVTWSPGIDAMWAPRIDRLCDLFDSGTLSRIGSMTVGTAPSRGAWPYTLPALHRFLDWLKTRLEAEIAAHP